MTAKILVVEDEAIIALEIQSHLKDFGYQVVGVAATAAEAVQMARARQPDLALMDIVLRGADDGVSASRQLREEIGVPVVFLTGHSDPATLSRAVATGSHGYLLKPFRPEELRAAVEVALAKHAIEERMVERWREMAATLQTSTEQRQNALAQQLHERIAQDLVTARHALGELRGPQRAEIEGIAALLGESTRKLTEVVDQMRPAAIASGLLPALHGFAQNLFEGTGISWEIAPDELWVFEPLATPLFRIAEAALINVKLYAKATHVQIELREQGDEILLRIRDDGQASSTIEGDKPQAFGFARMQRWVATIGAKLHIASTPGQGTTIEVTLPKR